MLRIEQFRIEEVEEEEQSLWDTIADNEYCYYPYPIS